VRAEAARAGRDASSVKFFAIATVIVARTDAEARAKLADYQRYASVEGALARWGGRGRGWPAPRTAGFSGFGGCRRPPGWSGDAGNWPHHHGEGEQEEREFSVE
jgi:alkanesulfonate monooxygenase SsuD/methylene tetrahydromethanopterin reductase-like flavin-dependent oxidoreductase (luciferase family)